MPPDETISIPPPDTDVRMAVPALPTTCDPAKNRAAGEPGIDMPNPISALAVSETGPD